MIRDLDTLVKDYRSQALREGIRTSLHVLVDCEFISINNTRPIFRHLMIFQFYWMIKYNTSSEVCSVSYRSTLAPGFVFRNVEGGNYIVFLHLIYLLLGRSHFIAKETCWKIWMVWIFWSWKFNRDPQPKGTFRWLRLWYILLL